MRQNKGKQAKRNTKKTLEQSKLVVDSRGGGVAKIFQRQGSERGAHNVHVKVLTKLSYRFRHLLKVVFSKRLTKRGPQAP